MSRAAELHSATALRSCLDELEGLGSDGRHLAEHLRGFLASYDMERSSGIVAQISRRTGHGSMTMAAEKILIVDDTAANIHLLAGVLEPRGYEILAASNAEQGLRIATKHVPDLILLDVIMPGQDGFASVPRAEGPERRRARFPSSS